MRRKMIIALPIWNGRISPVFDTAGRILVAEVIDGEETMREEHAIGELFPPLRVRRLKELGVEVLICGAVSNQVAMIVDAAGIGIVPWVSGCVEEIIRAFGENGLADPRFLMPGCRGRGGG